MSEAARSLAVVGAINVDLVVTAEQLPSAGETVTGGTFARHHGGKGGNQATAAARALATAPETASGRRVTMIGCVGNDDLGRIAVDALERDGIWVVGGDDGGVGAEHREAGRFGAGGLADGTPGSATGVALIVVDARGENQIAVAPGANLLLTPSRVRRELDGQTPNAVLASLEVPFEAVAAAAEWCRASGVPFILNPAPAHARVGELLELTSYVTPNEHELSTLGPLPAGVTAIETRGADGVAIHGPGGLDHVMAPAVAVVDTTGAGDSFNGVFAAGIVEGIPVRRAVERAVAAAALSVTRPGARDGMPWRADIDAAMAG
jgi:ribokinase